MSSGTCHGVELVNGDVLEASSVVCNVCLGKVLGLPGHSVDHQDLFGAVFPTQED